MSVSRVTKKTLTLAQAAEQWENAKRQLDELRPLLEEAEAVLKAHFEKTGRNTYKDRIALNVSSRTVLDQRKVREFLADRLAEFQNRITIRSLTLLK